MSSASENVRDFSLVVGGPLFQLLRRLDLSGSGFELLRRRIVAIVLVTWLPLLILSVAEGLAWGNAVRVPLPVRCRCECALPRCAAGADRRGAVALPAHTGRG